MEKYYCLVKVPGTDIILKLKNVWELNVFTDIMFSNGYEYVEAKRYSQNDNSNFKEDK